MFSKSKWLQFTLICVVIVLLPYGFSRLASSSRRIVLFNNENTLVNELNDTSDNLRIVCYNIAHGRGIAESNQTGGDLAERTRRLQQIAQLLRTLKADIVVLNEVDFDASWSFGVNQAQYLAEQAEYPYRIEQRNLDFRVLGWRWRFGNAILSRYPIRDYDLIKIPAHSTWESWLVGHKQGVRVEIALGNQPIHIIATHLEHRGEADRTTSVRTILQTIGPLEQPTILVGDLNSTPTGFPASTKDAQGNNAIDILDQSRKFRREPKQEPKESQFTYHSQQPDRVIDWILIPTNWRFQNYYAIDSNLSDHRPVVAEISTKSESVHSQLPAEESRPQFSEGP
jgi:endonuclease/exonuclease/phosphatase family metal-dependent hydrolase